MKSKVATEWEVEDIGVDNPSYFQGRGVSHTDYDDVAIGIGNTPREALDDALEYLAMSDWEFLEEPSADKEFPKGRVDFDYVSELLEEILDSEYPIPEPEYYVRLYPYNGCGPILKGPEVFTSRESALAYVGELLELARENGQETEEVEAFERWEIQWPGRGVGDDEGILALEDNSEAISEVEEQRERASENWESSYYYVAVYVKEEEPIREEIDVPSIEELETCQIVKRSAWALAHIAFADSTTSTRSAMEDWLELSESVRASWIDMELHPLARKLQAIMLTEEEPREAMERMSKLLPYCYGIEYVSVPDNVPSPEYCANYLNTGETYDSTILYETRSGKFFVSSWGDWLEACEHEYTEELDVDEQTERALDSGADARGLTDASGDPLTELE